MTVPLPILAGFITFLILVSVTDSLLNAVILWFIIAFIISGLTGLLTFPLGEKKE